MRYQSIDPLLSPFCQWQASQWMTPVVGATFPVTDPATGAVIATLPNQTAGDALHAIDRAQAALPAWQALTAKQRANILKRWFSLIMEHQEPLAQLMTLEQGKPLAEARGEVAYGASYIEWFAEEGKRMYGDITPAASSSQRMLTLRQPIGVVAGITPWNFPNAMITRKVAPALAAGCTIIIKPSDETPLSAMALVTLAHQAGIPDDAFQILLSKRAPEIGTIFSADRRVRKLTFTGSTGVGKQLMSQCAATVKKLGLELGGNAPFIVFDDADLDAAVQGMMVSKFRNAGQTCVCANRILVQDSIYDAFVDKLLVEVNKLKVGNGFEQGVTIGPLINQAAIHKVQSLVSDAVSRGATVKIGGSVHPAGDNFYCPTVLTDVTPDMQIFQSEIFGPVAPLFRFSTEEEAIRMANDTPFGLASYFYSDNMRRVWRVAEQLEYGIVGINEGLISNEAAPFGGVKESGLGREGSKYGLEDFTELKYLCLGGLNR